jgi:hypothetical protein
MMIKTNGLFDPKEGFETEPAISNIEFHFAEEVPFRLKSSFLRKKESSFFNAFRTPPSREYLEIESFQHPA